MTLFLDFNNPSLTIYYSACHRTGWDTCHCSTVDFRLRHCWMFAGHVATHWSSKTVWPRQKYSTGRCHCQRGPRTGTTSERSMNGSWFLRFALCVELGAKGHHQSLKIRLTKRISIFAWPGHVLHSYCGSFWEGSGEYYQMDWRQ